MKLGKIVLHSIFGSHIYGTNTPTSDKDYKGIFIPDLSDLLLQKAHKTSITEATKENERAKNSSNDIDQEFFTLQSFFRLCEEGQTVAVDLLFAPKEFWLEWSPEWEFIQRNRDKLIHRGVSAFYHYAKQQAAKYGIKGSRVGAVRQSLELLKQFKPDDKMIDHKPKLEELFVLSEFVKWTYCKAPNSQLELHLEVCNRKFPIHSRFKYVVGILQTIFDNYGKRALAAEKNENVDSKAVSHALRVCGQAKELLATGHVTFPRPDADFLTKVKLGEIHFKEVAPLIESGLAELEEAKAKSHLKDSIDKKTWDAYTEIIYASHLIENYTTYKRSLFSRLGDLERELQSQTHHFPPPSYL